MRVLIAFAFAILHVFPTKLNNYSEHRMSDNLLKIIPTNPNFVPDQSNQDRAKKFLKGIFKNVNVEITTTAEIEFVKQGSNFENVTCNYCGKEIDMDIWQHAMDIAHKNHFNNLSFETPCCHKSTSLNDLNYNSPAGFAKFQITISNPDQDIEITQVHELEKILGSPV